MKPDVCWQLPIRRSYRNVKRPDSTSYLEITITEFDRRGWGAGSRPRLAYCSADPQAHIGKEPVFPQQPGRASSRSWARRRTAELEVRCQAT